MSDVTVSLGLDLSLAGSGDFFTIGATPLGGTAIVGALPLAGDVVTDVTSYVRSVSVRRGRSKETEKFDAGRATVVLDNRARRFDPSYAAGPYYGSLKPRKAVTIDVEGQRVYTGQVEDWNLDYTVGGDSTASVVASDGMTLLAGRTLTGGTATSQATGARITAVLADAMVDWPVARSDIDTGLATLGADVVDPGAPALAYLQSVAASEPGSLFIDRNGTLAFRDRAALQRATGTTFADDGTGIPFTAVARTTGTELVWTNVSVTYTGGTATASATAAQDDYGIETLDWPTLLSTSGQAQDLADFWVGRYSVPTDRIDGLEVVVGENLTAPQRGAVLALEIGDLVSVTFTPNGVGSPISQTLSVESIEHEISDGGTRHTVRLSLSTSLSGFIIGQSLLGQAVIGF
jgi:hypothetical protein